MGPDYVPLNGRSGHKMDAARLESLWRAVSQQSRHEVQDQLASRDEPDLLEPVFCLPVRTDDGLEERGGTGRLRCSCGESLRCTP